MKKIFKKDNKNWWKELHYYLTASQFAAVVNQSPYMTRNTLVAGKLGILPKAQLDKSLVERGATVEVELRQKFEAKLQEKFPYSGIHTIYPDNEVLAFCHDELPLAFIPDGLYWIDDYLLLFEAKSRCVKNGLALATMYCDLFGKPDDLLYKLPVQYWWQCQFEMMICKAKKTILCVRYATYGATDGQFIDKSYEIKADKEAFKTILTESKKFIKELETISRSEKLMKKLEQKVLSEQQKFAKRIGSK